MMATNSTEKQKKKFNALENAHGAMGCYLYFTFLIVLVTASICVCLFLAEWLFPKYVHIFNYSLSTRTFVELKAAHKYKAAADFYEQKHEIFTTKGDKYINMIEVYDCYKRIGEYEKAEGVLRDAYNLKYLSEKEVEDLRKEKWTEDFFRFGLAKEFFNLYEEMGDKSGQRQYYEIMKSCLTSEVVAETEKMFQDIDPKSEESLLDLMKVYDIKMLYLDNPDEALGKMAEYLENITDNDEKKPSFVQKCFNLFISWTIEQHGIMPAYTTICNAVEYANYTDSFNEDKSEYGRLSDICYQAHDIANSKKFYFLYSSYLNENTSELDPLFIENQVRGFKFLEDEQNWSELEKQVTDCCIGLRSLLSKNISSMSESQREHFVSLIDGPFDYANELLIEHPSSDLAELCLNNSIFIKGLLLRSSRELSNKISKLGNPDLVSKYNELQEYRKELSYREGLGNVGNAIRIASLKKDIERIDKELAVSCAEYRKAQEQIAVSAKDISRSIPKQTAAIEFVQTESGKLAAIVLRNDDAIKPVNLGSTKEFTELVLTNYRQIYTDTRITDMIWTPIQSAVSGATDIVYSANGIFNSISFSALYSGNHSHLTDYYNFHLMPNIGAIIEEQEETTFNLAGSKIAMWGDVDYGNKKESEQIKISPYRDIERGQGLCHLVFSAEEINSIIDILNHSNADVTSFTGQSATETSFRSRSGMKDNIIHISTHGFFEEDEIHERGYNPMYNSGLFFAGADSTWTKTDTTFVAASMLDDGILRADEIQYLDFSDCSLAVLSACRTGLGQSKSTEGIYGLQRAFKLAGVEKILMSLWNVDDECTSKLMKYFYENIRSGSSYEDALRKAQSAIRKTYPSPEYWGAFVLLN